VRNARKYFRERGKRMKDFEQWNGFKGNRWKEKIDVRNFIKLNYTPYDGDDSFLEGPTEATNKLWGKLQELQKAERANGGVLDMETEVVTSLTAYGPGYIDEDLKNLEKVVGLQTDKPLKRAFMPYGGIKMAEQACETYGYEVIKLKIFSTTMNLRLITRVYLISTHQR
jgi:formate C-acetyltransferase